MRNRVGSTANMLRKGGYPLILLIENAAAIEKRYEVLLDREIYRFVSGETIELIGRMSGYVVGLAVFAKALAEIIFGDEEAIVRLDMSEYQGDDGLNRMIGGMDGTLGVLPVMLKEQPYGVVLLDEFRQLFRSHSLETLVQKFFHDVVGSMQAGFSNTENVQVTDGIVFVNGEKQDWTLFPDISDTLA